MDLAQLTSDLQALRDRAVSEAAAAPDTAALDALELSVLGKKGDLTAILRGIGGLPAEDRPKVGAIANEVRAAVEGALGEARDRLGSSELAARLAAEAVDVTTPGRPIRRGSLHPIIETARQCLLVADSTKPDEGTVSVGPSVKLGYFAQHAMDLLDGDRTVFQSLEDSFPQAGQAALRALAGCFGFPGDDIEKKCRVLSGGEKARLVMAKLLFDAPNFLVLDEPTNHLDIATKQMLIEALSTYEGTMLFVSHDRHFLAALSNRVLELTPDGVHSYGGGYTEYVQSTGKEAPGLRS